MARARDKSRNKESRRQMLGRVLGARAREVIRDAPARHSVRAQGPECGAVGCSVFRIVGSVVSQLAMGGTCVAERVLGRRYGRRNLGGTASAWAKQVAVVALGGERGGVEAQAAGERGSGSAVRRTAQLRRMQPTARGRLREKAEAKGEKKEGCSALVDRRRRHRPRPHGVSRGNKANRATAGRMAVATRGGTASRDGSQIRSAYVATSESVWRGGERESAIYVDRLTPSPTALRPR